MTIEVDKEDHRIRVAADRRARMQAQLCDAALRVMAENGPEATSIDTIVQAAGVARGTFYKYFDAPSDLIRTVGIELAQDLILTVNPTLAGYDDPAVQLSQGFRTVLSIVRANPVLGKFLIRAGWPVTDTVKAFSDQVVANLIVGLEQGRFRRTPLPVAQSVVGGLSIGMMAALIEPDAPASLEDEAALTLLLALGLPEAEARMIAVLPLTIPLPPDGGLLARVMSRG